MHVDLQVEQWFQPILFSEMHFWLSQWLYHSDQLLGLCGKSLWWIKQQKVIYCKKILTKETMQYIKRSQRHCSCNILQILTTNIVMIYCSLIFSSLKFLPVYLLLMKCKTWFICRIHNDTLNFFCLIIIYVYVEHSSFNLQNVFKIFKLHLWLKKYLSEFCSDAITFLISKFHHILY